MVNSAAPTLAAPRDLTGRRLGRYEVLAMLASGGMATVYVARAHGVAGFERLVAIKVLHPHLAHDEEFISMFLDEARLAARIRHPNAVGTLDISDSHGDGYFLVMEYVEGDHFGALLRAAAKAGARPSVPVVARIVLDALAGLDAAHRLTDPTGRRLELVHRDVSPHNILVGSDGLARITDFGVAKAEVRLASTRDGQFKGKLSYMAPEQAASGSADQRSDLFSMGIVLWEALTARRLFRGENNADVLNKILNPDVPPPSMFDRSLAPFDSVVRVALARERDDRFQTAEEFGEALEQAARRHEGVANPRGVSREVERWLGAKIARERQTIRSASDSMSLPSLTPTPAPLTPAIPEPGSQSEPSARSVVRALDEPTVGAKPSTLAPPEDPPRRRRWIALTAMAFVLCLGGALAAIALRPDRAPSSSSAGRDQPHAVPLEAQSNDPRGEPNRGIEPPVEAVSEPRVDGATDTLDDPSTNPRRSNGSSRRRTRPDEPSRGSSGGAEEEEDILDNPYRR